MFCRLATACAFSFRIAKSVAVHQRRFGSSKYKVVTANDAAYLIPDGASVVSCGFGGQAGPEEMFKGIEARFLETGHPKNLTVIFNSGPGDSHKGGLNRFAHVGLVKRVIGSFYARVPQLSKLVEDNVIEGYALPTGAISHMLRAAASGTPGHITTIGVGTKVDPRLSGGKLNEKTTENLVQLVEYNNIPYLFYKGLPINVALCRGTTGDPDGNITMEREPFFSDNKLIAMGAHNTRGLTIVQVERIGAIGSLKSRNVIIPGTMVDCVVQAKPENHWMSYSTDHNPSSSAEVRSPPAFPKLPLDSIKIIARRAALQLLPGQVVYVGQGTPMGLVSVSDEEKIFQYFDLTTEPGTHGGLGLTGDNYGAAENYDAIIEMNHQFDFFNGGGLDVCFLGMAQVGKEGDVNCLGDADKHYGPGGLIDISQATKRVNFVGRFMAGEVKFSCENGEMKITIDATKKKFVNKLDDVTFVGDLAKKNRQLVHYITERCVFSLSHKRGLELIEIAPGVDLEQHILQQMEYLPSIRKPLKTMSADIFKPKLMQLRKILFGINMEERLWFQAPTNTVYVNLSHMSVHSMAQLETVLGSVRQFIVGNSAAPDGKVNMVVNYENFDIHPELVDSWISYTDMLRNKYYLSVRRITGRAFARQKFADRMQFAAGESKSLEEVRSYVKKVGFLISDTALDTLFRKVDIDGNGRLNEEEFHRLISKLDR